MRDVFSKENLHRACRGKNYCRRRGKYVGSYVTFTIMNFKGLWTVLNSFWVHVPAVADQWGDGAWTGTKPVRQPISSCSVQQSDDVPDVTRAMCRVHTDVGHITLYAYVCPAAGCTGRNGQYAVKIRQYNVRRNDTATTMHRRWLQTDRNDCRSRKTRTQLWLVRVIRAFDSHIVRNYYYNYIVQWMEKAVCVKSRMIQCYFLRSTYLKQCRDRVGR